MKIECQISLPSNQDYQYVIFRKFFQIVFIASDLKTITIYTASVLGGKKNLNGTDDNEKYRGTLSEHFQVRFTYISDTGLLELRSENITKSFLDQPEHIRKVWGESCCIVGRDQTQIMEYIRKIGISSIPESHASLQPSNSPFLYTAQHNDESRESLSIGGKFECVSGSSKHSGKAKKDSKKKTNVIPGIYDICAPMDLVEGLEIVNWIRTTITLSEPLNGDCFKYEITFNNTGNVHFFSPDFTIYIGPPSNYTIDLETARVEKKIRADVTKNISGDPKNLIQPVAQDMDIYFEEWIEQEDIADRSMYRVTTSNFIKNISSLDVFSSISITCNIRNVLSRGNLQFILGLLASLVLAIGIDDTRLKSMQNTFLFKAIPADVQWVTACAILWLSLLRYWSKNPSKVEDKLFKKLRHCAWISYSIWLIYIFIIYRSVNFLATTLIGSYLSWLMLGLGGISALLYFFLTTSKKHKEYSFARIFGNHSI